jgi:hypothetical protein
VFDLNDLVEGFSVFYTTWEVCGGRVPLVDLVTMVKGALGVMLLTVLVEVPSW